MTQSSSNNSSPIFGDSLPGYGNSTEGLFSPWEYEAAPGYFEKQNALSPPPSALSPSPNPYVPPPLPNWQIESISSNSSEREEEAELRSSYSSESLEYLYSSASEGGEEAELSSPSSLESCEDGAPPHKRRRTETISSATTSSVTEVASQALKSVRLQPSTPPPSIS